MRILFISTMGGSPWGGCEELWSQTAVRLAAAGHHVIASVSYWPTLSKKIIEVGSKGVHVHRRLSFSWQNRLRRKILYNGDLRWLVRQSADLVVISQGSNTDGLHWMQLCQKADLRYTVILQSNWEGWWPHGEWADQLAEGYRSAQRTYGVSRRNIELLRFQVGEELPNAEVVRNPINVTRDQAPAWPSEKEGWKLACVGRLEPESKGQDLLFQVLAQPQWRERSLKVGLYGTGGAEKSLRKMSERLGLNHVYFHGHIADVSQIWAHNHLLVMPSRYEGLPLALVEAMCCERPALITDVGGNTEMCLDGETGYVMPAATVSFISDGMERAWNARHEWKALGQAARKRFTALVPSDPIGVFAEKLLALSEK